VKTREDYIAGLQANPAFGNIITPELCYTPEEVEAHPNFGWNPAERNMPIAVIETNKWQSHNMSGIFLSYLLRDIIGMDTISVVNSNVAEGSTAYTRIDNDIIHTNLEIWTHNKAYEGQENEFVFQKRTVQSPGSIGYTGRVGWYIPSRIVDANPDIIIEYWRALQQPEILALFPPYGTTPAGKNEDGSFVCSEDFCTDGVYVPPRCKGRENECVEFWHVAPNWSTTVNEQMVRNNELDVVVVYLGDFSAYLDHVSDCEAGNLDYACMFYLWRPEAFLSTNKYTRMVFPEVTFACTNAEGSVTEGDLNCDYETDILQKLYSSRFLTDAPGAASIISDFTLSDENINDMLSRSVLQPNKEDSVIVCEWMRDNEPVWRALIPPVEEQGVIETKWIPYESGSGLAFLIVTLLLMVGIILGMVMIFLKSDEDVIKNSNPIFFYVVSFGVLVGFATILLFLGRPSVGVCNARYWFISLACALCFGPIIGKLLQFIVVMKDTSKMKGELMTTPQIFIWTGIVAAPLFLLCIIWSGVDLAFVTEPTVQEPYITCASEHDGWGITLHTLVGFIVLAGNVLAIKAPKTGFLFNEAQFLFYAMLVTLIVGIIISPLIISLRVYLFLAIPSMAIFIAGIYVIGLGIFGLAVFPKIYLVYISGGSEGKAEELTMDDL